jgi:hypothetical protein
MKMSNDNGTQFTESPASWNTRYITPYGFTCQLTLRADTGSELLQRAESAISFLRQEGCIPFFGYTKDGGNHESPTKENNAENHSASDISWCPIHEVEMKKWSKNGKLWHSHKTDEGSWCNGKVKK